MTPGCSETMEMRTLAELPCNEKPPNASTQRNWPLAKLLLFFTIPRRSRVYWD
jgi:hypothetical protein